ncbi:MAG: hypothetical protein GXN94_00185 [Aquificae bacterium]|nr:hypothetical protein [Aquificota bacterium]
MWKILFALVVAVFITVPSVYGQVKFPNEGLTENQVYNIRLYTLRSLNLVLDAYSSLRKKRIIKKETFAYLDASMFFLNEAYQYLPSYPIKRTVEALIKRIKFYPNEDYSTDIRVLLVYVEELSASLDHYYKIKEELTQLQSIAYRRDNKTLAERLEKLKDKIKISLLDNPISEARYLIGTAKDHLKAGEYAKSKQALELALTPLIKISSRENLYVVLAKEYIYKAKFTYNISAEVSRQYLEVALQSANKAYFVSSEENRSLLDKLRKKINENLKKYDTFSITEKDFEDMINLIGKI